MDKFIHGEDKRYWRKVHLNSSDDLAAVCFPDRSRWFNSFFDRIQKYAIGRCIASLGINVDGKKVLDLGCGRGRWLYYYSLKGGNVLGIDISAKAIQACKQKGFTAINGSIINMPLPDDSYDIINSVTVLQHLNYDDQEKAASEISRILKPGGIAILLENTWNDPSPHVWGKPVEKWVNSFPSCDLIYLENHYYINTLMALWNVPCYNKYIENALIFIQYPIEYGLMKINHKKANKGGLQHLMVFRKRKYKIVE